MLRAAQGRSMMNWTIVLFATRGLADFVENALRGIRNCGIDPSIVQVMFPANARAELADLVGRLGGCGHVLESFASAASEGLPETYADFGTPGFNRIMAVRFPFVRTLLEQGKHVLHADVDVAWLRSPLDYLAKVLEHYPWAFQTEATPRFPPCYCLGFYAVRPAPVCFELIDMHIERYAAGLGRSDDQVLLNQILEQKPDYLSSLFPLSEALFANGLLHHAVEARTVRGLRKRLIRRTERRLGMVSRIEPFVFHANWTIGLDNKRRLLKRAGLWLA
jgi:hypothetical protein